MCVCLPGRYVDLQDPGLEVLVQHDVKAEQLVAAVRSPNVHLQQAVDVWLRPDKRETPTPAVTSVGWILLCVAVMQQLKLKLTQ